MIQWTLKPWSLLWPCWVEPSSSASPCAAAAAVAARSVDQGKVKLQLNAIEMKWKWPKSNQQLFDPMSAKSDTVHKDRNVLWCYYILLQQYLLNCLPNINATSNQAIYGILVEATKWSPRDEYVEPVLNGTISKNR